MLGAGMLLVVSAASAFAMIWLITYAPIIKTTIGIRWSPRLMFCKWLVPFDIIMTTIMVLGPWILGAGGLGHTILATFTSLGLSAGTYIVRKMFVPKWKLAYAEARHNTTVITL